MIGARKVLALIPARGGSKGIPRKNITDLAGKPLIAWTIEAAQACSGVDAVVLSTDEHAIAEVAARFGCTVPFMRPPELATDEASSMDVVFTHWSNSQSLTLSFYCSRHRRCGLPQTLMLVLIC